MSVLGLAPKRTRFPRRPIPSNTLRLGHFARHPGANGVATLAECTGERAMNMRRLPFVMLLTVSAIGVACSDPPPVENPPQPTTTASAEPAPTAVETAAPT